MEESKFDPTDPAVPVSVTKVYEWVPIAQWDACHSGGRGDATPLRFRRPPAAARPPAAEGEADSTLSDDQISKLMASSGGCSSSGAAAPARVRKPRTYSREFADS